MLVLNRRLDEGIVIGEGITIRVVAVEGKQVRLGVSAPESVRIRREELLAADESKKFRDRQYAITEQRRQRMQLRHRRGSPAPLESIVPFNVAPPKVLSI